MLKLCGELACGERTRKVQLVLEKVEVQTYTNGEWPRGTPFEKSINGKLLRCTPQNIGYITYVTAGPRQLGKKMQKGIVLFL